MGLDFAPLPPRPHDRTLTLDEHDEVELSEISPGDSIDVFWESAKTGWERVTAIVERVELPDSDSEQSGSVVVTKPDGFVTAVPPRQIPAQQF